MTGEGLGNGHRVKLNARKKAWFSVNHSILSPTEFIFYCKRAILFLSSSKILTPHPPLRPASLSSPASKAGGGYLFTVYISGGYTLAGRRGGWGGQYFGRREKQDCPLTVKYVLCALSYVAECLSQFCQLFAELFGHHQKKNSAAVENHSVPQ